MRGFRYPLNDDLLNGSYTAQWLLYVPPHGSILKDSMFCPHIVFMSFVCISKLTEIVSLYSIN